MTTHARDRETETTAWYRADVAYLADELRKLDGMLRLRVEELRGEWRNRPEASGQALYVGHDEVDWLLGGRRTGQPLHEAGRARLLDGLEELQAEIDAKVAESLERGVPLALPRLAGAFGLSTFEVQVVIVCLAPELRRAYDRIYAYLQDDITRKRPSVDLVLDLLCATDAARWEARAAFGPQAPLLRTGILESVDDPHSPSGSSGLSRFLKIDPRILHFLLGHPVMDPRLEAFVKLEAAPVASDVEGRSEVGRALRAYVGRNFSGPSAPGRRTVVHLWGPAGVGKHDLARSVSDVLGCPTLSLDARRLAPGEGDTDLLRLAFRESLLLQAPLYIAGADALLRDDDRGVEVRAELGRALQEYGWLLFLAGEKPWPHRDLFGRSLFYSTSLTVPGRTVREAAWRKALGSVLSGAGPSALAERLAERFQLAPGQIREAVRAVADRRAVHDDQGEVTFESLADACRAQARHRLEGLATKVVPHFGWDDLVLPEDQLAQLREMCSQLRHRERVYDRWGFGERLARGKGLSALFTGPPGTGKTMAAEVIAGDLCLDLYKIDLARVVNKYIGETEKNLARIFDEAENSQAILFFDEADALFGKRTEISDAHDRYANIETSYLLQRIEEYEGVVILASNLRENMDDAFLRRLRFIVQFPFPDAKSRLEIWRTHFPPEAPLREDVDCELLADRIQVAGGNIRNIVLRAAFFAASDGGVIGMEHFAQGTRREFEKIGKLWDDRALARSDG